jgi:hypothetical protein
VSGQALVSVYGRAHGHYCSYLLSRHRSCASYTVSSAVSTTAFMLLLAPQGLISSPSELMLVQVYQGSSH